MNTARQTIYGQALAPEMMLRHRKLSDLASRLRQALIETLNVDKVRIEDLGGIATTSPFAQAVVNRVMNS